MLNCGYANKELKYQTSLRGAFTACSNDAEFEYCRDADAADLLAANEVDLAFFGEDKLTEWLFSEKVSSVNVIDSLPINCRMVLAGRRSDVRKIPTQLGKRELLTVATSYPELLGRFACDKGLNLAVTYTPTGSVEAYAATGRTDLIFDIKQSGATIKANDLVVYREGKPLSLKVVDRLSKNAVGTDRQITTQRIDDIYQAILVRLREARNGESTGSLTSELCNDQNKLVKKYGEESAELLQAYLRRPTSQDELINESADLLYVVGVMLAQNGVKISSVIQEDIRRNEKDRI